MLDGIKARTFAKRMQKYLKDGKVVLPAEISRHRSFFVHAGLRRLKKWLKTYYHDPVFTPAIAQDTPADKSRDARTLVVRCFGVVDAMRHKPWAEVVGVLDAFYRCIENAEHVREKMFGESDFDSDGDLIFDLEESDGGFENYDNEKNGNPELFGAKPAW